MSPGPRTLYDKIWDDHVMFVFFVLPVTFHQCSPICAQ
jgi:hypothetical protein